MAGDSHKLAERSKNGDSFATDGSKSDDSNTADVQDKLVIGVGLVAKSKHDEKGGCVPQLTYRIEVHSRQIVIIALLCIVQAQISIRLFAVSILLDSAL